MLDYPVLRTVIARKIIHGDEASRNEGKMMEAELDDILSALRAAQQSAQDGFCPYCHSKIPGGHNPNCQYVEFFNSPHQ